MASLTNELQTPKKCFCVVVVGQTQPGSYEPTKTVTTCEEIYLEKKTLVATFLINLGKMWSILGHILNKFPT